MAEFVLIMVRYVTLGILLPALAACLCSARAEAFTVAIDPGHGGHRAGAISPRGAREKDVALAVARRLAALLEKTPGVHVVLTRDDDTGVELQERTKRANDAHADVLLSIHCNSMETRAARRETQGVETYFLSADATDASAQALAESENADDAPTGDSTDADPISNILQDLSRTEAHSDSKELAAEIHRTLVKALHARDRGVRQAPFIVLLGANMPAVLAEIGFISHPSEGKRLADPAYQEKAAAALRDALLRYRDDVFAKRTAPVTHPATASTDRHAP